MRHILTREAHSQRVWLFAPDSTDTSSEAKTEKIVRELNIQTEQITKKGGENRAAC
jgi:hypothetical protein